jgi:hypothetical protein
MKLFEQYLTVEEIMSQLRAVAKKIIRNIPTIPKEQNAELTLDDNYRIVVKRISASENIIKFLEIEVYLDDKHIGNINIDFISEAPCVLIAYDMDSVNEGLDYRQSEKKVLAKN